MFVVMYVVQYIIVEIEIMELHDIIDILKITTSYIVIICICIPYTWKVSMGESFAVFAVSDQTAKVSPPKFGQEFTIFV